MNPVDKKYLDEIDKGNTIIFNVEQELRKAGYSYAAETLYRARIEINNARSRGQKDDETGS